MGEELYKTQEEIIADRDKMIEILKKQLRWATEEIVKDAKIKWQLLQQLRDELHLPVEYPEDKKD